MEALIFILSFVFILGSTFDTLVEMFPCRPTGDIQSAIDVAGDEIEKAINVLLDNGFK